MHIADGEPRHATRGWVYRIDPCSVRIGIVSKTPHGSGDCHHSSVVNQTCGPHRRSKPPSTKPGVWALPERRAAYVPPRRGEITVYELIETVFAERGVHGPGTEVAFDVGPAEVTFDPARLFH